jgi:hypothetical protein
MVNIQLNPIKNVYWVQCYICSVVSFATVGFYTKHRHTRMHVGYELHGIANNTLSRLLTFLIR